MEIFLCNSSKLTLCLTRLCALSSVSQHALCGVVEVTVGSQSVLLPCHYSGIVPEEVRLPEDAKVDWRTSTNLKVHVYLQGCDRSEEQHRAYRNRTRINQDPLKTGDLSLMLQRPLDVDRDTYTCIVCSGEGHILLKKDVKLRVRGTGTLSGVRPRNAPPAGDPEVHPDRLMG
uniref:Ig-like domain-containing protein n=1 Tax=Xiphophorus couchianus TaxID=32473 RepID=A0A3B5MCH1_9TELE